MKVLTDAELFAPVSRIAHSMDQLERVLKEATQAAASSGSMNPFGILELSPPDRTERPPAT